MTSSSRIGEETSGGGLYRGYGPEIAGYLRHHRSIGGITVGDGLVAVFISAHFVEGLRLSAPVEKVCAADQLSLESLVIFGQPKKPLRLRVVQRFDEHSVDHAEDGGVQADAEREGEDDDDGEDRVAAQAAKRVAGVLEQALDPLRTPHSAGVFGDAQRVAEFA